MIRANFAPTTHLCVTRLNVHASHFTRYTSPTQKKLAGGCHKRNPPGWGKGVGRGLGTWGVIVTEEYISYSCFAGLIQHLESTISSSMVKVFMSLTYCVEQAIVSYW